MTTGNTTFFSYSREDSDFALRLAADLRAAGVPIWVDQLDIEAGAEWDESIEQAIESSRQMLVVLSPRSVESDNVMDEVSLALDEGNRVVPVLLEECDVPFRIRRRQYVDFTGDYRQALEKLTAALGGADEPAAPEPEAVAEPALEPPPEPSHPPHEASAAGSKRPRALIAIAAVAAIAVIAFLASRIPTRTRARQPARQAIAKKTSTAGSGLVVVPGVIGVEQSQALSALERQGLKGIVVSSRDDCDKPAGTILSQDPVGRTQARPGTRVGLVNSKRTEVKAEVTGDGAVRTLAPGETHVAKTRPNSKTQLLFGLSGDVCSQGVLIVSNSPKGREQLVLKVGKTESRTLQSGTGEISVRFVSNDAGARLTLRVN